MPSRQLRITHMRQRRKLRKILASYSRSCVGLFRKSVRVALSLHTERNYGIEIITLRTARRRRCEANVIHIGTHIYVKEKWAAPRYERRAANNDDLTGRLYADRALRVARAINQYRPNCVETIAVQYPLPVGPETHRTSLSIYGRDAVIMYHCNRITSYSIVTWNSWSTPESLVERPPAILLLTIAHAWVSLTFCGNLFFFLFGLRDWTLNR